MSYEQGSVVTISVLWEDNVTDLRLTIRRPDNTLDVLGFADVDHDSGAPSRASLTSATCA
jgi:hypothetical protein